MGQDNAVVVCDDANVSFVSVVEQLVPHPPRFVRREITPLQLFGEAISGPRSSWQWRWFRNVADRLSLSRSTRIRRG